MHQHERIAGGVKHNAGAGDVTGRELSSGEWRGSMLQELQHQLPALIAGLIAMVGECSNQARELACVDQIPFPKNQVRWVREFG